MLTETDKENLLRAAQAGYPHPSRRDIFKYRSGVEGFLNDVVLMLQQVKEMFPQAKIFGGFVRDLAAGMDFNDLDILVPMMGKKLTNLFIAALRTHFGHVYKRSLAHNYAKGFSITLRDLKVDFIFISPKVDIKDYAHADVSFNELYLPVDVLDLSEDFSHMYHAIKDEHYHSRSSYFSSSAILKQLRAGKYGVMYDLDYKQKHAAPFDEQENKYDTGNCVTNGSLRGLRNKKLRDRGYQLINMGSCQVPGCILTQNPV